VYTQELIKEKGIEALKDLDIIIKEYNDRLCLKYTLMSPKFNPVVKECRGLILSLPDLNIISRPFDKFFNYGEDPDGQSFFDWENSIVFEKRDGTLIHVYNYKNKWFAGTTGTAYAEGSPQLTIETGNKETFYNLFLEALNLSGCDGIDDLMVNQPKEFTYLFELTSPKNRIVTRYDKTELRLLAIRNNRTGKYIDYNFIAKNGFSEITDFCPLVKIYDLKNLKDIEEFISSLQNTEEGVVCYDYINQMRIKIKNPEYVKLHYLRGNSLNRKSVISLLVSGEIDEYLSYFPEDIEILNSYINRYNNMVDEIMKVYENLKEIKNQKEFAREAIKYKFQSALFSLRRGNTLKDFFSYNEMNYVRKLFYDHY
jgi:T4 RnlA family RNA ligase